MQSFQFEMNFGQWCSSKWP